MRVTRAKQYRRYLRFFRIVYKITPPYKVILDGNFIHGCLSVNVDIEQRLESVLQGAAPRLYVPRAARAELRALGPAFAKAYEFATERCRELPPLSTSPGGGKRDGKRAPAGDDDPAGEILATIGAENTGKYMVASQDEELRVRLRKVPGCPLMFVSRTVLVMEQPSGKSKAESDKTERKKNQETTEDEKRLLDRIKRKEREALERERASQSRKRVKRKAMGPNPLSCKRSKAGVKGENAGADDGNPVASNSGHANLARKRRRRKSSGNGEGGRGSARGSEGGSTGGDGGGAT